ncbi:MAG: hypothetical protein ABEJ03_03855 [Candidatus Nanohaloarchaea archaeon]
MTKITVGKILSWIFAIMFLINGITLMPSSPFGGVLIFLIGIFLIPNARQRISEEYDIEFSRWVVVGVAIVGLGIFGAFAPSNISNTASPSINSPTTGTSPQQNTDTGNQEQAQQEKRTKAANITIDRIETQAGNLYPTRVTVTNTGNVAISPKFDMSVYNDQGTRVCSGSPMLNPFGTVSPGEEQTEELNIGTCMMEEDGTYTLQVKLLDNDFNTLDTAREDFRITYWSSFQ